MKYEGWTAFAVLAMLCAFSIGAGIVEVLYRLALTDAVTATIPWLIVTLLVLPCTFAIQLLLKLLDLREEVGISRNEKRRLDTLVTEKVREVYVAIGYYLIGGAVTALAFAILSSNPSSLRLVLLGAGGLLGISICSMGFLLADYREVANFKAAVKHREQQIANQRAALEKLSDSAK